MNERFREVDRSVPARISILISIVLPIFGGVAPAQESDPEALPFALKVKRVEFDKKLRGGLNQVLSEYLKALEAIEERGFSAEAAKRVGEVSREKERFARELREVEKDDPLAFVAGKIGRLNRGEVELESHLAESTWQLTDGRVLKLGRNGRILLNGKREFHHGWETAGPEHFVWGGKFWACEVRDKRRRFNASAWRYPRQSLQGTFVDSVDYTGGPVSLMAREFGKAKLRLGTGLKVLLEDYAATLERTRKSRLEAGDLDEALAAKKEWEHVYEIGGRLFGSEMDLGGPNENVRPAFNSVDAAKANLIGSSWRLGDGRLLRLEAGGRCKVTDSGGGTISRTWEALDSRTILWGAYYHRVRLNPDASAFAGGTRTRNRETTGTRQK